MTFGGICRSALFITAAGFIATGAAMLALSPAMGQVPQVVTGIPLPGDLLVADARYDDLDLRTAQGQRRLDRRVWLAVREVCPNRHSRVDLRARKELNACRGAAFAQAAPQVAAAIARTMNGREVARAGAVTLVARR